MLRCLTHGNGLLLMDECGEPHVLTSGSCGGRDWVQTPYARNIGRVSRSPESANRPSIGGAVRWFAKGRYDPCTAVTMLKIGKYSATTIAPMTTPTNTISSGSIRLVSLSAVASTSRS